MPKKIALFLLLPLFLLCSTNWLTAQNAPEIRGIWVDTWGSGFKTKAQIDQLVADAQRGNLNTIFPQVRRRGDAFYNSNIEPKNPQVSPGSFDPLAYLIERAHAANPRIEVHAWIIAYPLGSAHGHPDHILNKNPDWIMEAANGSKLISNEYWADPAHPGVQQHIVDVSLDLINNYDIDGLQFDYIRYPSPDWGYNPLSVARFNNRFGTSGKPSSNNAAWRQFRRDAVTELVRRVYLEAINLKPMIKISAATIGQGGGITQTSQWPNSTAYSARFQDWRAWMQEGIIDINTPMFYYDAQGQWAHGWTNWITFAKNHKYNRHLAIGPAWYLNTVANSLTQIQQTRQPTSTGNRAEGVIGYNYATTNNGGVSRTNFLNALASGPFPGKAPIPPMPWKTNPTRGHAMGIVTANDTNAPFDHATINLNGPENRTVYSDGNGFYGAVDLIPGTYTITASMPTSAYDPATAQITVTAGSVSEADLLLEYAPAAEIIVDDTDAEFAGSWSLGTNPSHYGSGYRTSYPANAATATFRPMISIPGTYEIYVWYVSGSNRSAGVPHAIVHSGGQTVVSVDQTSGGGQWQLLATDIHFSGGTDGFVRISTANALPGAIMADAIRFSLIEADPDPADFFENPLVYTSSTQAIATWETVEPAVVAVEYGTSQLMTSTTPETTAIDIEHSVVISNLQANTTYHYRLHARRGSANYASNWNTFETDSPTEIIVDNHTSSVSFTGSWTTGSAGSAHYGSNYHLSYGGSVGATATFRPNLPRSGVYDVYTWYNAGGNRASNVPHLIQHAEGQTTVTVNQSTNGGGWQLLLSGRRFNQGTNGFVRITNPGGGVTIADAQRWVLRDSAPQHALTIIADGNGSVSSSSEGSLHEHGEVVELTATPASGSIFSHWEGDLTGNENPTSIRLYRDREVTAVFHPLFELTTSVSGEGTVEIASNETHFPADTEVEVLAVPAPGWVFLHWDGHLPGDENPALVWMDSEKSLTAHFGFSYEAWRETVFNENELADLLISAPDADPFGHGISNLQKYAFGLDLENPDFTHLPTLGIEPDGMTFTFRRLIKPGGIDYIIETSPDLSDWDSSGNLFVESDITPNADGRTETVTLKSTTELADDLPRIFLRIRVDER